MKKLALIALGSLLCTASLAGNPAGEATYKRSCAMCHMHGAARSPVAHSQEAWQPRFAKALATAKKQNPGANKQILHKKALAILVSHVKKGLGFMPAGGMCKKCTDKQYAQAIEFMMSNNKS